MENSVSNDVPEQTYNDDSLFRPMSLANVSGIADPSTDKSKMLHQIWNEHRSPRDTGTPLNEEEDIEGDHTSTPAVKELSANKSMATRFYERHFQKSNNPQGFTFNELHEKLDKANKENLSLKTRICLLEEDQGLLGKEDEENVYRINIDLKVRTQELLQELSEKDDVLKQALVAVEQQEQHEKERNEILNQLEDERLARAELQAILDSRVNQDKYQTEVRQSLLGDAFGSLILDPGSEDKHLDGEANAVVDGLKADIFRLESEQEIKGTEVEDLKIMLNEENRRRTELEQRSVEVEKIVRVNEETIATLNNQCFAANSRVQLLEKELQVQNSAQGEIASHAIELQNQNEALVKQLEMEQNSGQIVNERQEEEVCQLKDEVISLKRALDEETSNIKDQETYLNLKLTEISNLHKELDALKAAAQEKDEKLINLENGVDALAQVIEENNAECISINKELKKKTLMYDRLLTEYENAKAKVRKYRSERGSVSSNHSSGSNVHLDSPVDNARASYYIKQGAEKALTKANKVYNEHVKMIDQNHQQAMLAMRKRLEELAECLEKILQNGLLELTDSARETLQLSLNESRRLSRSVLDISSLNVTMEGIDMNHHPKPYVEVNLEDLEVEINVDLDNVINEVKAKHDDQIQILQAEITRLEYELQIETNGKQELKEMAKEEKRKVIELEQNLTELKESNQINISNKEEVIKTLNIQLIATKDRIMLLENELTTQSSSEDELEELRKKNEELTQQLTDALNKLRDNRKRQDDIDKVLRHQLAKTHSVLKRTKNAMNTIDNKENV